jgi:hypothetical protein
MKKLLALVVAIAISSMPLSSAATIKGAQGQTLSVSKTTVKAGSVVTVKGNFFDETVGIYLAFCVIPAKGKAPTPCGGGINKAGLSEASFWISSNPPPYAIGLTEEFLPGGRFTQKVKISKKIGKFDCTIVKCSITVRSDHLRSNYRSSYLFIPITIK